MLEELLKDECTSLYFWLKFSEKVPVKGDLTKYEKAFAVAFGVYSHIKRKGREEAFHAFRPAFLTFPDCFFSQRCEKVESCLERLDEQRRELVDAIVRKLESAIHSHLKGHDLTRYKKEIEEMLRGVSGEL